MSEKNSLDLNQIIEQFTEFIREKAEDDEDIRENVLPMIEELGAQMQESQRFQEEYPSISRLLAFLASTLEAHEQKLEILKDAVLEIRQMGMSPEEALAYQKLDKSMLN
jgi:hypothetical protein